MGYYSSLIQRKFRDLVGKKYEEVRKEYSDFLISEEEMAVPAITSILMPIDIFSDTIPEILLTTLSAYKARIHLVYIIDSQIIPIIKTTLGQEVAEEFKQKKEERGREKLAQFSRKLEYSGFEVQTRMFVGSKVDDVIRLSCDHGLLAISRTYDSKTSEDTPLSPTVYQISQQVGVPVIIY